MRARVGALVAALLALAAVGAATDPAGMRWSSVDVDSARQRIFGQTLDALAEYEQVMLEGSSRVRRDVDGETLTLVLEARGRAFALDLRRNHNLLRDGWKRGADGSTLPVNADENCFYIGTATELNDDGVAVGSTDAAALSTCHDRLEGFWYAGGDVYHLVVHETNRLKRDASLPSHIIYRSADLPDRERRTCAATASRRTAQQVRASDGEAADVQQHEKRATDLYVRLGFFGDSALTKAYGAEVALQRLYMIVNGASALYEVGNVNQFSPRVHIVATHVEAWLDDPFVMSSDGDVILDRLGAWFASVYATVPYRAAHVLTIRDIHVDGDPSTSGYANVAVACDKQCVGTEQDDTVSLAFTAETLAHEIGHNLNAGHDGVGSADGCPLSGYVMAAASETRQLSQRWSTCSVLTINNYLASGPFTCMLPGGISYTPPDVMDGPCLGRPNQPSGVPHAYCERDGAILLCPDNYWGKCPDGYPCTAITNTTAACRNANGETAEPTFLAAATVPTASLAMVVLALVAVQGMLAVLVH